MEDDNLPFDFSDHDIVNDNIPSLLSWLNQCDDAEVQLNSSTCVSNDEEGADIRKESTRKRLWGETCCKAETKAVREKLRRERFNEKILELSSLIDPTRPVRSDKVAILGDAIRILKQLKTEAQELEEARKKLNEEIKNLKAEKNELRQEKIALKADKERIEQQLKMVSSTSFTPSHPAAYHPLANPTPLFPGYSMVPMWQYLPQTALQRYKDPDPRPAA